MQKILLGLLVGLLLAGGTTAWSVLRRDTLQATPHGYKLPSLVVTGTSEFDGAVTLPTGDITSAEILNATITADDLGTDSVAADEIAANAVGAAEIANVTRTISIPLNGFIECETNGGAALTIGTSGADALPDIICSNTDGLGCSLQYDDTGGSPDTAEACAQFVVPSDYASGGAFIVRATKDAETGANTEVLNCQVSVNGAALEAAGTVTLSGTASASYTCTPTIAALAAGNSVGFTFFVTSGGTVDDTVDIQSVGFQYTATQ